MGLRDILDDIRQKVVEEGWFGRAVTPGAPQQEQEGSVWGGANATHIGFGRSPTEGFQQRPDFEAASGFGPATPEPPRELEGRQRDDGLYDVARETDFERDSGFGQADISPPQERDPQREGPSIDGMDQDR